MTKIIDLPMVLRHMGFTDNQFDVWDDGDGPYIKVWTGPGPQPTQAEIDAANVGALQARDAAMAELAAHEAAKGT